MTVDTNQKYLICNPTSNENCVIQGSKQLKHQDNLVTNSNKLINLTSSSESWPRKVELMCTFIQKM